MAEGLQRKPPTPQGISALLRKADFRKSISSPSRIKGMRNWSSGYYVQGREPGVVSVRHQTFSMRGSEDEKRAELARYREVIEAAGWTVSGPEPGGCPELVVTSAKDGE